MRLDPRPQGPTSTHTQNYRLPTMNAHNKSTQYANVDPPEQWATVKPIVTGVVGACSASLFLNWLRRSKESERISTQLSELSSDIKRMESSTPAQLDLPELLREIKKTEASTSVRLSLSDILQQETSSVSPGPNPEISRLEVQIAHNQSYYEAEIKSLQEDKVENENALAALKKEELERLSEYRAEVEARKQTDLEAQKQIAELKAKLTQHEQLNEIVRDQEKASAADEIARLQTEHEAEVKQREEAVARLTSVHEQVLKECEQKFSAELLETTDTLQQQHVVALSKAQEEIIGLNTALEEKSNALRTTEASLKKLDEHSVAHRNTITRQAETIHFLESKCLLLEQHLAQSDDIESAMTSQITILKQDLSRNEQELAVMDKDMKEMRNCLKIKTAQHEEQAKLLDTLRADSAKMVEAEKARSADILAAENIQEISAALQGEKFKSRDGSEREKLGHAELALAPAPAPQQPALKPAQTPPLIKETARAPTEALDDEKVSESVVNQSILRSEIAEAESQGTSAEPPAVAVSELSPRTSSLPAKEKPFSATQTKSSGLKMRNWADSYDDEDWSPDEVFTTKAANSKDPITGSANTADTLKSSALTFTTSTGDYFGHLTKETFPEKTKPADGQPLPIIQPADTKIPGASQYSANEKQNKKAHKEITTAVPTPQEPPKQSIQNPPPPSTPTIIFGQPSTPVSTTFTFTNCAIPRRSKTTKSASTGPTAHIPSSNPFVPPKLPATTAFEPANSTSAASADQTVNPTYSGAKNLYASKYASQPPNPPVQASSASKLVNGAKTTAASRSALPAMSTAVVPQSSVAATPVSSFASAITVVASPPLTPDSSSAAPTAAALTPAALTPKGSSAKSKKKNRKGGKGGKK
ncbi:hypothetical protein J1614_001396 [Plenodomus biglobosus]|nr:hypothetical protein J1614_001396 [Plenodomus biglobosus]